MARTGRVRTPRPSKKTKKCIIHAEFVHKSVPTFFFSVIQTFSGVRYRLFCLFLACPLTTNTKPTQPLYPTSRKTGTSRGRDKPDVTKQLYTPNNAKLKNTPKRAIPSQAGENKGGHTQRKMWLRNDFLWGPFHRRIRRCLVHSPRRQNQLKKISSENHPRGRAVLRNTGIRHITPPYIMAIANGQSANVS